MKILVVVAHPDDEVLGFGAAGAKYASLGHIIQPLILCGNVDARTNRPTDSELYQDMMAANAVLGFENPVLGDFPNIRLNNVDHISMVQFIEAEILRFRPDRIYTHHPSDLNDDHLQVSRACMAASRLFQRRTDLNRLQSLAFMEIPSSTDWAFSTGPDAFQPNSFVEIGERFLNKKIEALSCYRKVMRPFPHSRSVEALTGLGACRGAQSGRDYAEAFQTVFQVELE